jgi:hypothetical protein
MSRGNSVWAVPSPEGDVRIGHSPCYSRADVRFSGNVGSSSRSHRREGSVEGVRLDCLKNLLTLRKLGLQIFDPRVRARECPGLSMYPRWVNL